MCVHGSVVCVCVRAYIYGSVSELGDNGVNTVCEQGLGLLT